MHFADQRNNVGGTIFAAGEREESDKERVYAQPGGMRDEIGGDDSGDEGGDHGAEIGALKTKKNPLREMERIYNIARTCSCAKIASVKN